MSKNSENYWKRLNWSRFVRFPFSFSLKSFDLRCWIFVVVIAPLFCTKVRLHRVARLDDMVGWAGPSLARSLDHTSFSPTGLSQFLRCTQSCESRNSLCRSHFISRSRCALPPFPYLFHRRVQKSVVLFSPCNIHTLNMMMITLVIDCAMLETWGTSYRRMQPLILSLCSNSIGYRFLVGVHVQGVAYHYLASPSPLLPACLVLDHRIGHILAASG